MRLRWNRKIGVTWVILCSSWGVGACGQGLIEMEETDRAYNQVAASNTPLMQFERTYFLLPANADYIAAQAVLEATWGQNSDWKFTIGSSADDAGFGDLDSRRIIAWNSWTWGYSPTLKEWFTAHYPGVQYASAYLSLQCEYSPFSCIYDQSKINEQINQLLQSDSDFEILGEEPVDNRGAPREEYNGRTYILLHPDHHDAEWAKAVFSAGFRDRRYTVGVNFHEAAFGELEFRRIIVVQPNLWNDHESWEDLWPDDYYWHNSTHPRSLRYFLEKAYPGHEFFFAWVQSPEELREYLYPDTSDMEVSEDEHWVDVDSVNQRLIAYVGHNQVFQTLVRTGFDTGRWTPNGNFRVYEKHQAADMGCKEGFDYCFREVQFTMYFYESVGLHAAWASNAPHWNGNLGAPGNKWGMPGTHGCVNIPLEYAEMVFEHSQDRTGVGIEDGMRVRVRGYNHYPVWDYYALPTWLPNH